MDIQNDINIAESIAPIQDNKYSRVRQKDQKRLREVLNNFYGKPSSLHSVVLLTSGMHAIYHLFTNIILSNLDKTDKIRFIVADELYCDTVKMLKYFADLFPKFSYERVSITDKGAIIKLSEQYGAEIKLLYTESCTNPSGHMPDFSFLQRMRHLYDYPIVIDNTWLSSALFNPFNFGVDGVVVSLTKYYSGGRCLAGAILGKKDLVAPISLNASMAGINLSPLYCKVILDSLSSLSERIGDISTKSLIIAQWLEGHPKINRVLYPLLPSHPTYAVNVKQLPKGGPGCLYFHINLHTEDILAQMAKMTTIVKATSYGARSTRIKMGEEKRGFANQYDTSEENHIDGSWMRVAIGTADTVEEIKTDLDLFLGS
ncbi:hypothetical protein TI04_04770 [Achromatium sp. WMS2]|nr:hypothetical protein TI04_04770 [Achromatium sp. WMS2]